MKNKLSRHINSLEQHSFNSGLLQMLRAFVVLQPLTYTALTQPPASHQLQSRANVIKTRCKRRTKPTPQSKERLC